jgi:hypothetical protein
MQQRRNIAPSEAKPTFDLIRGRKNKGEHRSPFPLLDTMAISPTAFFLQQVNKTLEK